MGRVWKVLLALALVLPMAAYVAGSLSASRSQDHAPRETIVIRDAPTSPSSTPVRGEPRLSSGPDRSPDPGPAPPPEDDGDGDHSGNQVDDNGVRVVSPRPTPVGDDDGDDRDDSEDRGGTDGARDDD